MGIEAARLTADGRDVFPRSGADWTDWVSAGRTRNFVLGDPLLDWLELYGAAHGFLRDEQLPGYDSRLDFTEFNFRQGASFEAAVLAHLRGLTRIESISKGVEDNRSFAKAEETFEAMRLGVPAVYQGVMFDAQARAYGAPDLLVRADVLQRLFPAVNISDPDLPAADLGGDWHYVVVDVKFTTLHLSAGGELGNGGSNRAYKTQLFVYNQALGRLQGYTPPVAYLLGRGWEQTVKGVTARGVSCMERLAPLRQDYVFRDKGPIGDITALAQNWVRRVRKEGSGWLISPQPSCAELWPDMTNTQDGPWHAAKRQIAEQLEDLTLLWQVGVGHRAKAHEAGVTRWTDPGCSPALLGIMGETRSPVLSAILDVNRRTDGTIVMPGHVQAEEATWRPYAPLEFYVDFETVSDLAVDFSAIPRRGGQPLIFMIGCGHVEAGEWRFSGFTVDRLTEAAEANIIDAWLRHMETVRGRLANELAQPLVFHWSNAEVSTFESAYNAASARHPDRAWGAPNWFDFLQKVVRAEPVVVNGALNFGLKTVAKALLRHGFIQTAWEDGVADGLSAMVAAWWCDEEASRNDCSLGELPLMENVGEYNEIDCKVMMEIIQYLRKHH